MKSKSKLLITFLLTVLFTALTPLLIQGMTRGRIYSSPDSSTSAYTCLVPGAFVYKSGKPSGVFT